MKFRTIPALCILDGNVVNTVSRQVVTYVGCPINAVKIFSAFEADEICVIDIGIQEIPNFEILDKIARQSLVPLSYGGRIRTINECESILSLGFEKVIFRTALHQDIRLIEAAIARFGSQAVCISVDTKWEKNRCLYTNNFDQSELSETLNLINELGVGEVLLNNVDSDGMRIGVDLKLAVYARSIIKSQLLYSGGVVNVSDLKALQNAQIDGCCISSVFVEKSNLNGVVLDYFKI